jgi:hypothetical protein
MNAPDSRSHSHDDAAIDRLVAGELDDPERRGLLLALENDPDGWRRCALAFLEDQTWRHAFAHDGTMPSRSEAAIVAPVFSLRGRHWIRRGAIAASIIASTFAAGFAAGGSSRAVPRVEVAKVDRPKAVEPKAEEIKAVPQAEQVREVGSIDLVDGSGGESPPRRIPILAGPGINERWLREQPPSVPDYVRARWERQGYQVEERRKLVSVTLEDGRRVSIPVDEVELDYVGQHPL